MRTKLKNLFIFISDALRYDYVPHSIASAGRLVRTLASSTETPPCIASIVTGRYPQTHKVWSFNDTLKGDTIFDYFEEGAYYDYPDDPMSKIVLKDYFKGKRPRELKEPFAWIERAMDTHYPYGAKRCGNVPKPGSKEYRDTSRPIKDRYTDGVMGAEAHFWDHVEELRALGLLERTLIIFTFDHGELLGEYGCFFHCGPPVRELVEVPTVFLNGGLNLRVIRHIDLLPTCLGIMGIECKKGSDGIDCRQQSPTKGISTFSGFRSTWRLKDSGFEIADIKIQREEFDQEDLLKDPSLLILNTQKFWSTLISALIHLYSIRKYDEAVDRFNEALLIEGVPNSSRARALRELGNLYLEREEYDRAQDMYNRYLPLRVEEGPLRAKVLFQSAGIHFLKGEYHECASKLSEFLGSGGVEELSRAQAYYKRGSSYKRIGLLTRASKDFWAVLSITKEGNSPESRRLTGGAYFHLGEIYRDLEQDQQAIEMFQRCLTFVPDHKKAAWDLGLLLDTQEVKMKERLRSLGYL
jgi:TolA-binding protein